MYQKLYELYIEECEKEPELKVCVLQLLTDLKLDNKELARMH